MDPELPDFTPTATLYEAYLNHATQYEHHSADPEILNPIQFGVAFRRIWGIEWYQRRRSRGQWGYTGVRGPGSHPHPRLLQAAPAPAQVQERDEDHPDEDV